MHQTICLLRRDINIASLLSTDYTQISVIANKVLALHLPHLLRQYDTENCTSSI